MASISSITLPDNNTYDIKDARLSGIITVKGTQTETTASWTGAINIPALYDGLTIAYYLPRTSASNVTLNLTLSDGTTTGAIPVYVTSTTRMGTHYGAGSTIILTYWSAGSILVNGTATTEDRWTHGDYWQSNSNTVPSAYCTTTASTAAKTATCTSYHLTANSYLHILISTTNTVAGAITLNVNSTGAIPIYINGEPSSSTNYTLPAGTYITFYDGTAYHFRTDGKLPGEVNVATATTTTLGVVKPDGTSITIDSNGVISSSGGGGGSGAVYIEGTQQSATAAWTGSTTEIDFLLTGTQILYRLPYASAANATLELTLSGVTTGAIPIFFTNTTRVGTQYGANSVVALVYDATFVANNDNPAWVVLNPYTNSNTYDRVKYTNAISAQTAITASCIIGGSVNGYNKLIANTTFDILYPILWANSAIEAAATGTDNYLTIPSRTLRNNKSGVTFSAANQMVYLVGTLNGTTFTVDTDIFALEPSTEDGLYYIPVGLLYSTYQIYFIGGIPNVYQYKDGRFQLVSENVIAVQDTQPTSDALVWIDTDAEGADFCFVGPNAPPTDGSVTVWIDTTEDEIPIQQGAAGVTYDNTDSGLTATTVQSAIDELCESETITATYIQNSYCTQTSVERIRTNTQGKMGYITFNLNITTAMPYDTSTQVTIGNLGYRLKYSNFLCIPSQISTNATIYVDFLSDGTIKIANYDTNKTAGSFYRATIPVILA